MIREQAEIAVLGAGFAGSLTALVLHRMGRRVVLLERGSHPRFSLGESSTPLANLALDEIAREYGLPWLANLAKYGRWKKAYPQLPCGLKRGFTFARHEPGLPFVPDPEHGNELLVAASPADEVGDTHWLRADFDHFLAQKAVEAGVPYLDRVDLQLFRPGGVPWQLRGTREGEPVEVTARFLIDATGPAGALARALDLRGPPMRTSSWCVYSHFEEVERWEEVLRELGGRPNEHPYRCDDAALHHVLDDGWVYVLRFDNGLTSAGVLFDGSRRPPDPSVPPEEVWRRTLSLYPALARQFRPARPVRPWVQTGRLQRRVSQAAGPDWVMLAPSAYTLDALYSTGNAHALLTIQRLARLIGRHWGGDLAGALAGYDAALLREIDFLDRLVHGSYRAFRQFGLLASFTMYYFAGAIAAEERRRQGRAGEDEGFLSSHDPAFRSAFERGYRALLELADRPGADVEAYRRQVAADIAPWNTVGLCDPRRRNLYPYS
jgi:FADH2 O2-dependent halogenase